MPSGRTHDRITLWMLPFIVGLCYLITHDGELTLLFSGGFFFSGLMFGPDLDIHSIQFKRWGIFRYLWLPYQKLLRHRSFFSHGLIIGTIIRIIYLSVCLFVISSLLIAILQLIFGFDWNWQTFVIGRYNSFTGDYKKEAICLFLGLELGAMSHSISDFLGSAIKKKQKKTSQQKQLQKAKK